MLKHKILSIIFLGGILLSSCSDWLTVEPSSGVVVNDFWQSKEDVESAVISCYSSMQAKTNNSRNSVTELAFMWGELRGDMVTYLDRCPIYIRFILDNDIKPDNRIVEWGSVYKTINFCNTVLEFAPAVMDKDPSFTQKQLDGYMAEAYTLRALMYFYLVRSFGEAPLVLQSSSTDDQDFLLSKSDNETIFNQIKADLLLAQKGAVSDYGTNESNRGRITRYAVNAILADVYLWTQEPDLCLLACDEIINSGQFGLVTGDNLWFSHLYGEGNSSESIFELQFDENRLNPFYNIFHQSKGRQIAAAPKVYEELFMLDENVLPDSIDIRGDNASYKSSRNSAIWKYLGWNSSQGRAEQESYANFIFYRYSDILLLKAEALVHLGRGEEALELIYRVRKRSRASTISDENPLPNDYMGILKFLLNERAREFAFEGKRWYDALRVARFNNYEYIDMLLEMVKYAARPDKQQSVVSKHRDYNYHYFPISQYELDVNPNLVQNEFFIEGK